MKLILLILLISLESFSQRVEILGFFSKRGELLSKEEYLSSYRTYPLWDKNKLDSLFLRTLSLEKYKPKYLSTLLKDQDTFEELNCYRVVISLDTYYIYTNNKKQSLIVSRQDLRTNKWKYFPDMEKEFSLTLSLLEYIYPDYDINRLKWKIRNP